MPYFLKWSRSCWNIYRLMYSFSSCFHICIACLCNKTSDGRKSFVLYLVYFLREEPQSCGHPFGVVMATSDITTRTNICDFLLNGEMYWSFILPNKYSVALRLNFSTNIIVLLWHWRFRFLCVALLASDSLLNTGYSSVLFNNKVIAIAENKIKQQQALHKTKLNQMVLQFDPHILNVFLLNTSFTRSFYKIQ